MKHTLLATTALVAMTGAAAAEITISGSARIGMVTTEGAAAVTAVTANAAAVAADDTLLDAIAAVATNLDSVTGAVIAAGTLNTTAVTADELVRLDAIRAIVLRQSTEGATAAIRTAATTDLASVDAMRARIVAPITAGSAKAADTTVGKNRVRISFAGSGETDGGLTYGFSARADHSNTSTGGTQYISGAFGKITMGDLNGGDEQLVGNLSGVGSSGAGSHQEFGYQSSSHNVGYSISMAGVSFAATTDLVRGADATKTGSNSAIGIKWSGDMGGSTVGIALGQSKIGTVTEDSMSASASMGGLSIMVVSHSNDNGPVVAAVTAARSAASGTADVFGSAVNNTADTDTTGLSLSYAMDAMSVTAFTRTESTSGVADKDYSGVGFTYNMGGATLKAGFVDANDISVMDFGVNFSF
ncbi:porin [Paracoccaceae bacterium]|nr:porin [Paracoccaceae bacterium]